MRVPHRRALGILRRHVDAVSAAEREAWTRIPYAVLYFFERHQLPSPMIQRIDLARDIHPLSAFRKRAALIDQVQETRRPLALTRNGRSAAVVLDAREFERMVERLELLEDVHLAREQARRGETVSQEQALDYLSSLDDR